MCRGLTGRPSVALLWPTVRDLTHPVGMWLHQGRSPGLHQLGWYLPLDCFRRPNKTRTNQTPQDRSTLYAC